MYKNCVLLGDLNIVRDNTQLQNLYEYFLLEHLIKKPTCYKGDNPTGIDHIIKNIPKCFMKSMALDEKGNDNEKENYRPVSMFSSFSKVFEKLLFEQINDHMQSKFSKHLTGFLENHSNQNALVVMIEKWKTILNKKLKVGALFMDSSKAFDTLDHSLLLAKLSAYGFDNHSLSFVRSYLTNRIHKHLRLRITSVIGAK